MREERETLGTREKIGKVALPWFLFLGYWLFPGDFDWFPGIGQIDEAVLFGLVNAYTYLVVFKNESRGFGEFLKKTLLGKSNNKSQK